MFIEQLQEQHKNFRMSFFPDSSIIYTLPHVSYCSICILIHSTVVLFLSQLRAAADMMSHHSLLLQCVFPQNKDTYLIRMKPSRPGNIAVILPSDLQTSFKFQHHLSNVIYNFRSQPRIMCCIQQVFPSIWNISSFFPCFSQL